MEDPAGEGAFEFEYEGWRLDGNGFGWPASLRLRPCCFSVVRSESKERSDYRCWSGSRLCMHSLVVGALSPDAT